jgi:hypothetical protein
VVKGEDSQLSGCGFKPHHHILDGVSKASYYIGKREIKVAKWGTPKKYFNKVRNSMWALEHYSLTLLFPPFFPI